jgi:hypothetical protein
MLLIYTRTSSYVPLKILSIENGTPLKSFNHLLHRNKKVDFIEQFNEKLLVKQDGENLQILDVLPVSLSFFFSEYTFHRIPSITISESSHVFFFYSFGACSR